MLRYVYALIDRWSPKKLEMDMRAIVFLDVIGPKEYGLFWPLTLLAMLMSDSNLYYVR